MTLFGSFRRGTYPVDGYLKGNGGRIDARFGIYRNLNIKERIEGMA